jgi:conjugative transfer signal peptidase TraF
MRNPDKSHDADKGHGPDNSIGSDKTRDSGTWRERRETPRLQPATPPRRRRWRRALAAVGATAILLTTVPLFIDVPLRFLWNASASVPRGLYMVSDRRPVRGDLAVVRPAPDVARYMARRRYVPLGIPLLKPVVAASGATACRDGIAVTIDGRPAATALRADRLGRPLPVWTGCVLLGVDEFFLIAGGSPASFDSRYFGPVKADAVVGRAVPIWTAS